MKTNDKAKKENQDWESREYAQGDQSRQGQISFIEDGVQILYAGVFNIGAGQDEMVLTFGNQAIDPSVIKIDTKIAVTLRTAKRMAIAMSDIIRRYETKNGEIEILPNRTPPPTDVTVQ